VDIVVPNDGNTYTNGGMYIIVRKDGPTSGTRGATFYFDEMQLQ
jgi:hypothetical protein